MREKIYLLFTRYSGERLENSRNYKYVNTGERTF